jgi:zinc transport system permease protein
VGFLITPEHEILEALFGDISNISAIDAFLAVILSIALVLVMRGISKGFILSTISSDLAKASNVMVSRINFVFLLLVAIAVALGIKAVGSLLMGALVIIPAITSKNITSSLRGYTIASSLIGLISLLGGMAIAAKFNFPPGPIVILASSAIFLVSLLFTRK